jgi:KDO2-lipid IV(A) lauroyltransferase
MSGLVFYPLRGLLAFLSLFSFKILYYLAYVLSPLCFYLIPKYRKRALSNLTLAKDLSLTQAQVILIAKQSLFHLLLTALEYGKLYTLKSLHNLACCLNPQATNALLDHSQGVIFFCGHQSNWELLFLDATSRHVGVCIGKPIKNTKLYNFILSIRQKFKGRVIIPKEAYKGCMKALKKGELVGIVGDQGLSESTFTYNCFGRPAHMTTLPALLSLRSGCPIFVATIIRYVGRYEITYTGPLEVDPQDPSAVDKLTLKSLEILDDKIKAHPEQWMWQHNRWKIPYPPFIPKKYRHDAIAVIMPLGQKDFDAELKLLKSVYQGAYLIVFKPHEETLNEPCDELIPYHNLQDCFITHYGPKLLIDKVGIKGIEKHFKKLALFEYIYTPSLHELITIWKQTHAH